MHMNFTIDDVTVKEAHLLGEFYIEALDELAAAFGVKAEGSDDDIVLVEKLTQLLPNNFIIRTRNTKPLATLQQQILYYVHYILLILSLVHSYYFRSIILLLGLFAFSHCGQRHSASGTNSSGGDRHARW